MASSCRLRMHKARGMLDTMSNNDTQTNLPPLTHFGAPRREERETEENRAIRRGLGSRGIRLEPPTEERLRSLELVSRGLSQRRLTQAEQESLLRRRSGWRERFYQFVISEMDPSTLVPMQWIRGLQQELNSLDRLLDRFSQRNRVSAGLLMPFVGHLPVLLRFLVDILESFIAAVSTYSTMSAELELSLERIRDARDKSAALNRELAGLTPAARQIAAELIEGYINSFLDPLRKIKEALLTGNLFRLHSEATRLAVAVIDLYFAYKSATQRLARILARRRHGPGRAHATDTDGSPPRGRATEIPRRIQAKAWNAAVRSAERFKVQLTNKAKMTELYVFHLARLGAIPQLQGIDSFIPGHIGLSGAGKDLWGARRGRGGPIGLEIKLTYGTDDLRPNDLRPNRFSRTGSYQGHPEVETEDWIRWVDNNEELAESIVRGGRLGRRWIYDDEIYTSKPSWKRWVREHGPSHFRRPGNRFVIVVSPNGTAGVTDQVLSALGLPPQNVIQLAAPEGL